MGAPVAASDAGTAVVVGPAEAVGLSDVVVTSLVGVRVAEAGRRCEPPEQPVAPAARARAAATADATRFDTTVLDTRRLQALDDRLGELRALDLGRPFHEPGEVIGDDPVGDRLLQRGHDVAGGV